MRLIREHGSTSILDKSGVRTSRGRMLVQTNQPMFLFRFSSVPFPIRIQPKSYAVLLVLICKKDLTSDPMPLIGPSRQSQRNRYLLSVGARPLLDSFTACRGQNRASLQFPRSSAIQAQALRPSFLRREVARPSAVAREAAGTR